MEHSRRIFLSLAIAVVTSAVTRPTSAADPGRTSPARSGESRILTEYRQRRAALNVDDRDEWYTLAKWLDQKARYDLALDVLNEMIQRFPDHKRELLLRNMVLQRQAESDTRADTPGPKSHPSQKDAARRKDERLTPDQVNLIKVWELDLSTRPRVIVPRKTIDDLFRNYAHSDIVPKGTRARRRFRGREDYQQTRLLFELDARDLLEQVQVRDEPVALRNFRKTIHQSYVISYCGTRHCHGGDDAAAFRLIRTRSKEDRTSYTNFYILHRYESAKGYMIDRDAPQLSLLIQYGLLPDDANLPHVQTDGWRPFFRNRRDSRFINVTRWVGSLAEPLRMADYGVSYVAPPAKKVAKPPAASPDASETPPEAESDESAG